MTQVRTIDFLWTRSKDDPGIYVARSPTPGRVPAHDHVFHEIVYVESGTAEHVTAGPPRNLRPGDLIVIQPRVWHEYRHPRDFTIINILFDNRLVQRFGDLLGQIDGSFDLFRRRVRRPDAQAPVVLHTRPADRPALLSRIESIITERHERRNGWQVAVTASFLEILLVVVRLARQEPAPAPGSFAAGSSARGSSTSVSGRSAKNESGFGNGRLASRADQAVLDAVSHLEANYNKPFRLLPLARMLHLSAGHLSRGFSKHMGIGIVEFMNRLRIEEACRLLQWTDEPIGAIARRVGYNEIAYFSRCFRGQMGSSPRAYRQARRNLAVDGPVV